MVDQRVVQVVERDFVGQGSFFVVRLVEKGVVGRAKGILVNSEARLVVVVASPGIN